MMNKIYSVRFDVVVKGVLETVRDITFLVIQ